MRLILSHKKEFLLNHTSTDTYWYCNPVDNHMGRYLFDDDGWEDEEGLTEGAALVAPHHLLTWED